ncbi:MAG: ethanolamine permease [Lewinellaceae bacterium]|nr:ethanolamine permease [Saprospiraceae bacterium]MCB9270497.1 ethanolamine permease [Lewinellaceae bacterium]HPR00112.1 ethanolamine permease [Saprospiraceae bacterium]HQU51822.1 ethanolamine permease [Saprospiraceae bacterium]
MESKSPTTTPQLERKLGPVMLWGLGVGYVISGMYFGWNLGLEQGGTQGLAIATAFVILMYLTFTFSYTEMACAIPKAGGAFDYAYQALGKQGAFFAGMAQNIEFIFAPPAIAFAIGAYIHLFLPMVPILTIAIIAYLVFTALNVYGIQAAATFELFITILAVLGLILFFFATGPSFSWDHLKVNALPHGWTGVFAAIPFAIWFFLAIEGVANVAEETIHPQRNILIGFGSALLTLVVLCLLTFMLSIGVNGWETVVYDPGSGQASDSPLPLALSHLMGQNHWIYRIISFIGISGLVASFHGIILAAGRATYEFGRMGFAPAVFGKIHPRFKTPSNALMINTAIGIVALFTGKTAEIITIACFGALTLYALSMISMIRLRRQQPDLPRPFRVPFYPASPIIALVISLVALVSITIYNHWLALIYAGILLIAYIWFTFRHKEANHES